MKFFHWITFILLLVILFLIRTILTGYVNQNFGLYAGMLLDAGLPLVLIIYCLAWVWKWNKGEAKFF